MGEQVVVLGMHRSGTSTISLVLKELGVRMGDTTLGAGVGNPFGHEEDRDFFDLNCRILKNAGGSWDFPPTAEKLDRIAGDFEVEILDLISKKNAQRGLWGWKEPRTSILFDYYSRFLPDAKIIHVMRDPMAVAMSLQVRNRMPIKKGLRLCAEYERRLEGSLRKIDRGRVFKIAFEDLLANGSGVVSDLVSFLGIDVEEQKYANAVDVVKPKDILDKKKQSVRGKRQRDNLEKAFQHPARALMILLNHAVRFMRYRLER